MSIEDYDDLWTTLAQLIEASFDHAAIKVRAQRCDSPAAYMLGAAEQHAAIRRFIKESLDEAKTAAAGERAMEGAADGQPH